LIQKKDYSREPSSWSNSGWRKWDGTLLMVTESASQLPADRRDEAFRKERRRLVGAVE